MTQTTIKEQVNFDQHSKKLYTEYGKKLGYDDEKIAILDQILDTIEAIMQKHDVRQQSIEWDRKGTKLEDGELVFPDGFMEVVDELIKENQIGNLYMPEEMGGLGYANLMAGAMSELMASYDFSLNIMAKSGAGVMSLLLRYYDEAFDEPLRKIAEGEGIGYAAFTEPQAGSNLRAIKATSELVGDEYVLNGTKIYITNGGIGNVGIFLANNIVNGKKEGTNVFLVDGKDGIKTLRLEEKSGLKVSPTAQLQFENVTVPKEHLIGPVGRGYDKVLERLMGMRISVAFQSLAACKRAYELSYNHAITREQFGRPIIAFSDIQRKLKFMERQIPRIQEMAYGVSFALDLNNMVQDKGYKITDKNKPSTQFTKKIPYGVKNDLIHYYVSSSKLYCGEIPNYLLYDAQQVFGGLGFISETEVNKIARDVRILSIFDGTTEIHKFIINREHKKITKLPEFKTPMSMYDEKTHYETILYDKFPDIERKL